RFLRTRVRRELVPLLEELSPGIVDHLTALADELVTPMPEITEDGRPVALPRAHVQVLRRALPLGKAPPLALARGRTVVADPKSDGLRVDRDEGPEPRGPTTRAPHETAPRAAAGLRGKNATDPRRGGAKPGKSG